MLTDSVRYRTICEQYCSDLAVVAPVRWKHHRNKKGVAPMTPYQAHLAEQASTEADPTKLQNIVDELSRALDDEVDNNRASRSGCEEDCREHDAPLPLALVTALPKNVTRVVRWA
jgi:hypothetical protein